MLDYVRVATTGARAGDQLEGTNPVTKSALLLVCLADIPPYKRKLDELRDEPDIWQVFLRHLGSIAFFADMSQVERAAWLEEHQTTNERIGTDDDAAVRIQVLGLGSSVLSKDTISAEHVAQLTDSSEDSQPRQWSTQEVSAMIPANNGQPISDSGRHTLFFIKDWVRVTSEQLSISSKGTLFAGAEGSAQKPRTKKQGRKKKLPSNFTRLVKNFSTFFVSCSTQSIFPFHPNDCPRTKAQRLW